MTTRTDQPDRCAYRSAPERSRENPGNVSQQLRRATAVESERISQQIAIQLKAGNTQLSGINLPAGWRVKMSRSMQKPYYGHPDHGTTWHYPGLVPINGLPSDRLLQPLVIKPSTLGNIRNLGAPDRRDVKSMNEEFANMSVRGRGDDKQPIKALSRSSKGGGGVKDRGDAKQPNKVLSRPSNQGRGVNVENKNGGRPLHKAARQFNETDVKTLVNVADKNGDQPLHRVARQFKEKDVKTLLAAGANMLAKNKKGDTALDSALLRYRELVNTTTWTSFGRAKRGRVGLEADVMPPYETMLALMSNDVKEKLFDEWMPPRMRKMLLVTAELEGDELRESIMRYVPANALKNKRSHTQIFKGFEFCFRLLGELLRYGRTPTVENATKHVNRFIFREEVNRFLGAGGKLEFVIDALLGITENVHFMGDDGWEYDMFEEEIEALIETPLDGMYDLARFMLINGGGGVLESRGPYEDWACSASFSWGGDREYYDY